jgi:hypothetical protein
MGLADRRSNRRCESRYRLLTGQQVAWSSAIGTAGRRKGWVLDVSRSGLGVMMESNQLPNLGEEIKVRLKGSSEPVSYEVVRVQDNRCRIATVGCARVYGRTARLDAPGPAGRIALAA